MQRLDRLEGGFPDRVSDCDHRRQTAVDSGIQRALALLAQTLSRRDKARHIQPQLRHETVGTHRNSPPRNLGRHAETRRRLEAVDGINHQATLLCRADDGFADRVLGAGFDRRHQPQHFVVIKTFARYQIGQFRAALGQGAGLVEGDHAHVTQRLQGLAFTKQHPQLGRTPRTDHDRGGRGQPHRTRAGNDEYRHRIDQSKGQRRRRPEDQPDQKGQRGRRHHGRDKPHGDLVHQRLDRQLGTLGLFDQADDLRQHCVGPDPGHAKTECPGLVDRAANHFSASSFMHRHRFPADHALVDIGGTFDNLAVEGNFLARTH